VFEIKNLLWFTGIKLVKSYGLPAIPSGLPAIHQLLSAISTASSAIRGLLSAIYLTLSAIPSNSKKTIRNRH